jgi:hypothetical protein
MLGLLIGDYVICYIFYSYIVMLGYMIMLGYMLML